MQQGQFSEPSSAEHIASTSSATQDSITPTAPWLNRRDAFLLAYLPIMTFVAWFVPERMWTALCFWVTSLSMWAHPARTAKRRRVIAEILGRSVSEDQVGYLAACHSANYHRARIECLRWYRPGGWNPRTELIGREHIEAALRAGRGAILWVTTMASSDIVTKMSLFNAGFRVSHLSRPGHGLFSESRLGSRLFNPVWTNVERHYLKERLVMSPGQSVRALRDLLSRVRANGLVSITVGTEAHRVHTVSLLNGRLGVAAGPPELARTTGAALLPVFTVRTENGSFVTIIEAPLRASKDGDREGNARELIQEYASLCSSYVSRYPDLYQNWDASLPEGSPEPPSRHPGSPSRASPAPSRAIRQLNVRRVHTAEELATLRDAWNELSADVPFRRWEWLESWWRYFRTPSDELYVLIVSDPGGRPLGIAPWYLSQGRFTGRTIRFLGSGVVCSDYLTILTASGWEERIAAALASWLTDHADRTWHAISLVGVLAEDRPILSLLRFLSAQGHRTYRRPAPSCWCACLPASWNDYVAQLPPKRRKFVRRLERRRFDNGRAAVRRAESPEDLQLGMRVLEELHQRRWSSLGQPGRFSSPSFSNFLRETAGRFLEIRRLWLQWVELDGRPVAAEVGLLGSDTLYFYQGGIDPERLSESPGSLSHAATIKGAIERGIRHYDFLRGDEPYKRLWLARPQLTVEIRVAAHSATARLRHKAAVGLDKLRLWKKRTFQALST
jgi:CelD/BcsL family acetyltransferase involved in cellulose biosynthesis/lauroyl/myristoyl acyltransferase